MKKNLVMLFMIILALSSSSLMLNVRYDVNMEQDDSPMPSLEDLLRIDEVQMAGRKRQSVADFLRGHPVQVGTQFGQDEA